MIQPYLHCVYSSSRLTCVGVSGVGGVAGRRGRSVEQVRWERKARLTRPLWDRSPDLSAEVRGEGGGYALATWTAGEGDSCASRGIADQERSSTVGRGQVAVWQGGTGWASLQPACLLGALAPPGQPGGWRRHACRPRGSVGAGTSPWRYSAPKRQGHVCPNTHKRTHAHTVSACRSPTALSVHNSVLLTMLNKQTFRTKD